MNETESTITYRRNTAGTAQIADHLRACSHLFRPPLHEKIDIDAYAEKMFRHAERFEAWDPAENIPVGLVCAYFNDPEKQHGFITNVSTLGAHSGRGIGFALMTQCVQYGAGQGFADIRLEVHPQSDAAIRLYRKFGFETLETTPTTVAMRLNIPQM
ncbi:MAG: GNAT family N-acetyltransferase [Saprospiraceae bacterium]|nr:GNAT family N-acetyltransferase [Saprospiraceae bacterium]